MRKITLFVLLLVIFLPTKSQVQVPAYLGEAAWVRVSNQQGPVPLKVTTKIFPATKKVTLDSNRKIFQKRINPNTQLLHNGPTTPVVQNIQFAGKKLSAPDIIDAPPLLTRDNASFNISYTDKKHGFAGTNTTGFAEDSNHNIWIASDKGLYRYDGYHYFLYGPKNGVPTMPNLFLFYDNLQRLWLGSDNGVYYIQHDSIFSLKTDEIDFTSVPCFRVQQDYMNNIWLSTKKNGAIRINGTGMQVFDKRCGLPSDYIMAVHFAKDGTLYIGMREIGMVVIEKDKMRWLFGDSKKSHTHSIPCFYEDEDGLWAGTVLGGFLKMGKKDTIQYSISGKYNERTYDIQKAPGGLWIASYSLALCYFNKTNMVTINETNGLLNRWPYMLFEDSFHNLWVSSLQSGFSRINENSFYIQPHENPAIGFVRRWMPDDKKGRWIVTEGRGLLYEKNNETIAFSYKDKYNIEPFLYPQGGIRDDDGSVWTGSYGPGIVHFNGTVNTAYLYTKFPTNSIVRFVEKDAAGNIWFCPTDFGVIRYNYTSFVHYTQKNGLLSNSVSKILLDGSKQIYWSFENGIQRLTNETIETLFIGNKVFADQVNDLYTINNQTTLLASNENGLLIISNHKVYQITKKDGLSSNTIKTIIRDGFGKFWITTAKGIESFFLEGINIIEHSVFNETNGPFLIEAENAFLDTTGTPYWSYGDKKLVLNTAFLQQQKKAPVFSINEMFVNDKLTPNHIKISILPNQKININYTAVFWGRENNLVMKYLLISDRGDTNINVIGDKGHIFISEILPGNYRIILSAQDNNNLYYSAPIFLEIRNYWYNNWLFRITVGMLLLGCIIYYFKHKAERQIEINNLLESKVAEQTHIIVKEKAELLKSYQVIEEQNQEKDVLIEEINHRVKNNLQFMISIINMQLRNKYSDQTLLALKGTSSRIKAMSLVHEMLYYKIDRQILSTQKYINELLESLKQMAGDINKPVHFNVDIIDIQINSRTGISLGMIISELVINSLKYAFDQSEYPEISIQLAKDAATGEITLTVSDNGKGIKGDFETQKGLGSRLVDIFSRQLKGKYTIDYKNQFMYTLQFKIPSL